MTAAVAAGKSASKAVYAFSADPETGKVAHVNYLPKPILESKALDAKLWLNEVAKVIGGKVITVVILGVMRSLLIYMLSLGRWPR